MAELNVKLEADVRQLLKALDLTEKQLLQVAKAADLTQEEIEGIKSPTAIPKLNRQVKGVTPTMLEFNRVIQDAPFGIQGVANNITQLTQNFGQLSRSAGGTLPALRLLLGSLAGPAGILFAVSAITTLLVQFGDQLFRTADAAKTLGDEIDNINKRYKLQLDTNELITEQARLEGKEVDDILNTRLSILDAQLAEIDGLIQQKTELKEINKELQDTVSDFEAISQFALVTAGALAIQQFQGLKNVFKEQVNSIIETAKLAGDVLNIEVDTSNAVTATNAEKEAGKKIDEDLNTLTEARIKLLRDQVDLQKQIRDEQQKGAARLTPSLPIPDRTTLEEIFGVTPEAQERLAQGASEAAAKAIKGFDVGFRQNVKILEELGNPLEKIFSTQALETVQANITGGLTNLFASIGTAIAEGGNVIGAIGSSLLQGFGRFISDIGQLLIQYGTLAVAKGKLDLAVQKGGLAAITAGGAAIAIGAAAVAVGAALSAAGNRIGDRAQGGFVGGGGFTGGVGQDFTGGTSPIGGGFTDSRVVFEISGTSLVGVLSRTLNRNQRLGAGIIS